MMRNQNLDFITTLQYKNAVLIPVTANIAKLFGTKQIKFQVAIKNNKLIFESPEILVNLDLQDNHQEQEILNVR